MIDSFSSGLQFGMVTHSDPHIISMKTNTDTIKAGDLLKVIGSGDESKVDKVSANTDSVFGLCVCVLDGTASVLYKGAGVANPDSTIFSQIAVGGMLKTSNGDCTPAYVLNKLSVKNSSGVEKDGYEVLFR